MILDNAIKTLRARYWGAEAVFATIILGGLAYCIWHVLVYNYLPQPFFYEPDDLFADWYNTAYWGRDPGTYDVWRALYPPISFIFLRMLGIDSCYPKYRPYTFTDLGAGLTARDCDWLGLVALGCIFLINLILIYRVFNKWDRRTAIPRTICLALGLPMVDGLERGNLVLVSFTFLLLAFAPLLRSAWVRWICAGIAVNFKVYLIGPVIALLLKRRWGWVERALIATVIIYLVTYLILGRGSLTEIYGNIAYFAGQPAQSILDFWYSTTYQAFVSLLEGDAFPFAFMIGSDNVDLLLIIIPTVLHATQAIIMLAALAIWLRPEAASTYRIVNLAILMVVINAESSGYTEIYFILFTLLEPWKGGLRKTAIVLCYLLALPLDFPIGEAPPVIRDTYFGHSTVYVSFKIMIGPFFRPLLIMIIAQCISLQTLRDVWRDVRMQGWAERWRFRRDMPLLPWIKRPSPPASS